MTGRATRTVDPECAATGAVQRVADVVRPAWTTVLPPRPRSTAEDELVAGGRGALVSPGQWPGHDLARRPGRGRVGARHDPARRLPGHTCAEGQLQVGDGTRVAATGGALVVAPVRVGTGRGAAGLTG